MDTDIERYRTNLRDELNGAELYAALADAESDPVRKDLFMKLSKAESTHAQFWRDKLSAAGLTEERFVPDFRTRLLARLARRFGPRFVLPTIAAAEFADRDKYWDRADAQRPSAEERGHAAVVQAASAAGRHRRVTGADIAAALRRALRSFAIEAVLHLAGSGARRGSVRDPAKYQANNVTAAPSLLEAMRLEKVTTLVFSSTCSVYGNGHTDPCSRSSPWPTSIPSA